MQAYPNGAGMPVRYMVPNGYQQPYPPFVNQSFDRFNVMPTINRAPPVRGYYPPSYGPGGYPQGNGPTQPGQMQPGQMQPGQMQPGQMQPGQMQPRQPQPGQMKPGPAVTGGKPNTQPQDQGQKPAGKSFFNPFGKKKKNSIASTFDLKTPVGKKGPKEFKDNAFTIDPDGKNNTIKGLVSNDDINTLLKHKGTKVKVAKIYRITKTKPEELSESSDDEEPPPPPPPAPPAQRPRSSSTDSYCSMCDERPCSQCLDQRSTHDYDDCPICRAERQNTHIMDDCPECIAERNRMQARR